jgi:hypothetical protein
MNKILILLTLFVFGEVVSLGQTPVTPRIHIKVSDSTIVDNVSNASFVIPSTLHRITNFNPSISLADTSLAFAIDSLRTDGTATIVTVYETDADSTVGLWQIGSDDNRALWLNSQRVSYDDFSITYRHNTEHGVVIHTMRHQYPAIDSNYNGHDTIYLGREGDTFGDKNFCAFLYYPGQISSAYQRQLESALAVRYGALLHGPYVNSHSDTIWNPLADDSLYSFGVCGIGRDDSLSLSQPRSVIRNGILTLEAVTPLSDLDYIMLGCDSNAIDLSDEVVVVDTVSYLAVARHWKLRPHTYGHASTVRLAVDLPVPAEAIRLMIASSDGSVILTPDSASTFTLTLANGEDYYIALLANPSALLSGTKGTKSNTGNEEYTENEEFPIFNSHFSIYPNPSSGHYTVRVAQSDDDIINIRVVDANGRIVEQHTTSEPLSQYTYNGHLSADGIYYVTVTSNGRRKTIKLIVVR